MNKLFSNIWFRCISVLLLIACISGGLLAIFNDLLYVSPEERTARAVKKIYGVEKTIDDVVLDVDGTDDTTNTAIEYDGLGTINKIYKVSGDNGNYDMLFQSTGFGGYKGGTITVWVLMTYDGGTNPSINKVILESYEKQTLMSKLDSNYYSKFELTDVTTAYLEGKTFAPTSGDNVILNPVTGATKSANAGCNAVNCVLKYVGEN